MSELMDILIKPSFKYESDDAYAIQLDFDNGFHCLVEIEDQEPITLAEALHELAILVEKHRDMIKPTNKQG